MRHIVRHGWNEALVFAATFTLTVGAICILLFAM